MSVDFRRQDQLNPSKVKGRLGAAGAPAMGSVGLATGGDQDKKYGAVVSEIHPGLATMKATGSADTEG